MKGHLSEEMRYILDENSIRRVIDTYGDMLFRIALTMLASKYDAEDAIQETFIRYITRAPEFQDDEYRRAWMIRVVTNVCKDMLRNRNRRFYLNPDELDGLPGNDIFEDQLGVFDSVMSLPVIYREVILLYYIEDYKVKDISKILGISISAVKKRLQYARQKLSLELDS